MTVRASSWLRILRGAITALVAGILGAAAHVSAGGRMSSGPWLVSIAVLFVDGSTWALGVPAGRARLMALIGGGRFACHLLLTALAGHAGDHHTGSPPARVAPRPAAAAPGNGPGRCTA